MKIYNYSCAYHKVVTELKDSPWEIEETSPNCLSRVYYYKGYRVWLSTVRDSISEHANVYLYTAITPKNKILRDVGMSDIVDYIISNV